MGLQSCPRLCPRTPALARGPAPLDGGNVNLAGSADVALQSRTVQTFALAIHELAPIALKFGALKQLAGSP